MTDINRHNVKKGVDIDFSDGVTRVVFPLTINQLRKFVVVVKELQDITDTLAATDEQFDAMLKATAIVLQKADPELANDLARLEDVIDLVTFNQLMSVAMGNASPEG